MNLRKKKKRLKRQVESMRAELDGLMKIEQPLVRVERPEVVTISNLRIFSYEDYEMLGEDKIKDIMRRDMLKQRWTGDLIEYGKRYTTELYRDGICVTAKLRVVKPDGGDGI